MKHFPLTRKRKTIFGWAFAELSKGLQTQAKNRVMHGNDFK